jgi:hypothetical protein
MRLSEDSRLALKGAERAREIMDMRIRGMTFEAIGKALKISAARVYQIFKNYLQKIPSGAIEDHRKVERERIADQRARLYAKIDSKQPEPDAYMTARLIDSLIRLGRHEAMILGMDVQPKDGVTVVQGFTIDDIRELLEAKNRNTATLTDAVDVTPRQIEAPVEPVAEPAIVNGAAHGLTFEELLSARDGKGERE